MSYFEKYLYMLYSLSKTQEKLFWGIKLVWAEQPSHFKCNFIKIYYCKGEPGSSVSIATELRAELSGDRIPVERGFPPIHTGSEAHLASCTMGTESFLGLNIDRGVTLTTQPFLVPWSWKCRAIPLPNFCATTGPVTGSLYLYFYIIVKN